jgi:hypothetical protein
MGKMRCEYKVLGIKPKGKRPLGQWGVDWMIIGCGLD